jgi:DNA polymerase-1
VKHLLLIDASSYIFRAFHALPALARADGTPVNAVLGFLKMVKTLTEKANADHQAMIFDARRRTFRNDIYAEYKAQRSPTPDDLVPQLPIIREAAKAFGIAVVEQVGFEADDLIATYAELAVANGARVTIASPDKDLMQLVCDGVAIFDPMKRRMVGPREVMEKFGVAPERVIDVQALCGDSSDNIPGVPKVGIKAATALATCYGDLESVLASASMVQPARIGQSLIDNADLARISKQLVTLKRDVPVEFPLSTFARVETDPEIFGAFLVANGIDALFGPAPDEAEIAQAFAEAA